LAVRSNLERNEAVIEHGIRWFEFIFVADERVTAPRLIAWPEVSTHNRFVVAEYLSWSPHWAHLMRLTLEMGWHDVHRALGKL
jgi:hypothetical protein